MPTWDTDAELEEARDISAMVHDADHDHPGAGTLASGYHYGPLTDLHSVLYGADLVGWWPLHEQSGQANDLSGQGNHGTVTGATQGVGGRGGLTAYSFDGSDDYVNMGQHGVLEPTDVSLCCWVKTSGGHSGTYPRVAGNNWDFDGYIFHPNGTFEIGHGSSSSSVTPNTTIEDGSWHFLVGTWDESTDTAEVYVDGASDNSSTFGSGKNAATNPFVVGANPSRSNGFYNGLVAAVRVYDRVLSSAEVKTLHEWGSVDHAVPPDNSDDGVSYYDFNSANANDQWGSNDGTVNGATYVADGGPREDGAYSFDGTDDVITVPDDASLDVGGTDDATWSLWLYHTPSTPDVLFAKAVDGGHRNYQMYVNSSNNYQWFDSQNSGTDIGVGPAANTWNHLVVIHDGANSEVRIYENGERIGTVSLGSDVTTNSGSLYIGEDTYGNFWDGDLDEFRMYSRALDPWEVAELYQYGTFGRDMRAHTVNAI